MANELNIQLDPFSSTGLILIARVHAKDGTEQTGSPVTCSEVASALYTGDFALASISDDAYSVRFETNTPDELYGTGKLFVRNGEEVTQEGFFNSTIDEVTTDTASRNASKADVTGLSTFDPSTDPVANVTLVGTCTTNTDQRGTDGANTIAPDNAGITANGNAIAALNDISAADVDTELTNNHGSGSWQSAAGTINANVISVDGDTVSSADDFKANVSGLSTFDASSETVTTDTASREASKADLSDVGTRDNQSIINENVKKSSKLIPASGNLPDS